MGLDMHVYKTKDDLPAKTDFQFANREYFGERKEFYLEEFGNRPYVLGDELFYWRKHPNLHGWMGGLYTERGGCNRGAPIYGTPQSGNFIGPVQLVAEDLDILEDTVERNRLPHTTGFFFGESRPENIELDRSFIRKARWALEEGYNLFYTASW